MGEIEVRAVANAAPTFGSSAATERPSVPRTTKRRKALIASGALSRVAS